MLLNGVGGRSQFGEIRSKRFPAYCCYSGKTTRHKKSRPLMGPALLFWYRGRDCPRPFGAQLYRPATVRTVFNRVHRSR